MATKIVTPPSSSSVSKNAACLRSFELQLRGSLSLVPAVEMWSETEESRRQATEEGSAAGTLESLFFAIWLSVRHRRVAAYRGTALWKKNPAEDKVLVPKTAGGRHVQARPHRGGRWIGKRGHGGRGCFEAPLPLC